MTNGEWDFCVQRVDLDDLCIDAGQRLGMVIAQPECELIPNGAVPFRISEVYREAQKDLIEKAFQIRAAESQDRNVPIPFVLFPEAAIPVRNPDGLDYLNQQIQQAQGDVIFIGGLEGLSPEEAQGVAERFSPGVDAARPCFVGGAFVNVCVIVVKSANGRLSWYFQAKLRPSPREQQRNLARGQRVLYFVAPRIAFLCQICFDHIAAQGEEPLNSILYRQLIENARPSAATLDFVFIPQFNPQPCHESMRNNTRFLLTHQDRLLMNEMTAVVVSNKAASVQEPSDYGRSGLHYRAGRWQVRTSEVGPKGYELYDSDDVTSAVFRKRTNAIHVATLIPPSQNIGNSGNSRLPLENPRSYLVRNGCDHTPCSCLPGTTCTVGTYVECDCLPCKLHDALLSKLPIEDKKNRWQASDDAQSESLAAHYQEIRAQMLALSCVRAGELLDILLHEYKDKKANPDTWIEPRPDAIVEMAAALCVLREWKQPLDLRTRKEWTALLGDFLALVVLDGEDYKHSWKTLELAYWKAFEGEYFRPEMRLRPVLLVVLRSKGRIKSAVYPSWIEFTEPQDRGRLGDGQSIAEHNRLRFYICQGSLLEQARLERLIKDFIESEMRCVYG